MENPELLPPSRTDEEMAVIRAQAHRREAWGCLAWIGLALLLSYFASVGDCNVGGRGAGTCAVFDGIIKTVRDVAND